MDLSYNVGRIINRKLATFTVQPRVLREKIPIAIAMFTFEDDFSWECATPKSPSPRRPLPMSENCGGAESEEPTPTTLRSRGRFLGASAEEEEEATYWS